MSDEKTLKVWEVKLYGEQQPQTIEADTCTVGPLWNAQSQTNRAEFWRDNELVAIVPTYEMIRCLGEAIQPEGPPASPFEPPRYWRFRLGHEETDTLGSAMGYHFCPTRYEKLIHALVSLLDEYERS